MNYKLQRCPQCKTVGKVHRSRLRNVQEKIIRRLVPVYGVYRCHHCNWRGWMLRRSATHVATGLLIGGYILLVVIVIAVTMYLIIDNWPTPEFKY